MITPSLLPFAVGTTTVAASRVLREVFAGRTTRSDDSRYGADLAAAECVVSERDRVDAHAEELVGEPRRDADAVRGVLAVHDARVDLELRAQRAQALVERLAVRGARRRRR